MIRVLCLIGGLAGGAGLSQYPEFSQQYLQRLAGQVDALTEVVKDFDASALAAGLGREQALEELTGSPFLQSRQADMRRTFARHARLAENLMVLRDAGPLTRLTLPHHMGDTAILRATWADFTPAVPISVAGAASGGVGFAVGWGVLAVLLAALTVPFRKTAKPARKNHHRAPAMRHEPALSKPTPVATPADHRPRLAGVQR
ncbi:DUF2937 family protein [Yoonia sp.]|uniref:DUF2937 family protein n=1 Tax=Yoonia sp. TaxID=2212373 RepID=UPI0025ECB2B9|nr:DUF2937 family protein [Yoonia sp.]